MADSPSNSPRILVLHARDPDDPILDHEFECFVSRSCLTSEHFERVNVGSEEPSVEWLEGVDALFVGGSGRFSVASPNFEGHDALLSLMKRVVEEGFPMFASCFGFQALVKSLGGRLETVSDYAEIGTHEIRLTEAGRRDPLFGQLPRAFPAQLGHNDSVVDLPEPLVCLASSEVCPVQAIRVPDAPVVATQFHPELNARDNIKRYMRYLDNYENAEALEEEERRERAEALHRPSPESNQLVNLFLKDVFGGGEE